MEAWGIFFTAFTLFGMLGLWVAAVRVEESEMDTTACISPGPAGLAEVKKAA